MSDLIKAPNGIAREMLHSRVNSTRVCRSCDTKKDIDDFYITDKKRGYRKLDCKDCDNVRRMQRYYEHQEDEQQRAAKYQKNNRPRYNQLQNQWRNENREFYNQYMRDYRAKHK